MTSKVILSGPAELDLIFEDDYVIAYGDGLYVFKKDGSQVFSRRDFKRIWKIALLPNHQIIVDFLDSMEYVILSTEDGKTRYRIKRPKMLFYAQKFDITNDGIFLYDLASSITHQYVIRIDLSTMNLCSYKLSVDLCSLQDSFVDQNDNFYVLQSRNGHVNEKTSECSIWLENTPNTFQCVSQWTLPFIPKKMEFCNSPNKVILAHANALYIYNTVSGVLSDNLANQQDFPLEHYFHLCRAKNQYLILTYDHTNVVFDAQHNTIIAKYFADFTQGCIVGNEYWICSDSGILRKPFPMIEGAMGQF